MDTSRRLLAMLGTVCLTAAPGIAWAQPTMNVGSVLRDAGEPYTIARQGQSKLAYVNGTWWGVFGGSTGVDFYRFDPSSQTWSKPTFPGSHVTSDVNALPDVKWDGANLIVLWSTGSGKGSLSVSAYTLSGSAFQIDAGFPVTVVPSNAVVKEYTIAEDSNGRLWLCWQTPSQYAVNSTTGTGPSGWTSWSSSYYFGNASTGIDGDLGDAGVVAFGSGTTARIGIMWTECFNAPNNHTKFIWRDDSNTNLGSSSWSPVELCQEDSTYPLLTDDHLSVRSFEGQVWACSKTNYSSSSDGYPRFTLMRRDLNGNWTHWIVKTITGTDYSTRPALAIDTVNRLVYTFWHNYGIQYDTTPIDSPGTFSSIQQSILPSGGGNWDCETPSFPVTSQTGLMVVADDNNDGWTYWQLMPLGGSTTQTLTSITVTPNPGSVQTGSTLQFSAQGKDQNGNPMTINPVWSSTGGTISSSGLYTAGQTTGTFQVTATSGSVSGNASVNITASQTPVLTSITVTPNPGSVQTGGTLQFSAQGKDQNGNPMSVTPSWTASGGTISSSGLYTAGQTAGTFQVTATSGSVSGTATVSVTAPAPSPTLTSITVTPNPASTTTGGTVQFSAQGFDQNGNAMSFSSPPTWSATGGTITSSGLYTAGQTTGTFQVTASSGGVSGSANVTISAPSSNTTVIVDDSDPGFSVVSGGWAIHYSAYHYGAYDHAQDTLSGGACQWKPQLAAANYNVYAWWPARSGSATATYTITTTTGQVSVTVDQTPSSTWGTWNLLGNFNLDSTCVVQISCGANQNVAADAVKFVDPPAGTTTTTSTTTSSPAMAPSSRAPASPLTVTVTPNPANVVLGGTQDFHATVTDASGREVPGAQVAWSAEGGSIDSLGHFTTGSVAGTFRVTASVEGAHGSATVAVQSSFPNTPAEVVVDDLDSGFGIDSGTWELHSSELRYGSTDRRIAAGSQGTCRFAPTLPRAGTYDVYAWWPASDATTRAVPYTVHGRGITQTTTLDQSANAGQWVLIGRYPLAQGSFVTVTAEAGVNAAADAMRFVYVGP